MTAVPIPAHDYHALPAGAWLFVLLLIVTFWLHLLFVGTVLGSMLFLLVRRVVFRAKSEVDRALHARLLRALPVSISMTITLGVAPLLFVQVLYGHYFYTSNILIAPYWMLVLGLLLVGFVSAYLARWFWPGVLGVVFALLAPACFLGIGYVMTNNAVLAIQPEHWIEFHRDIASLFVRDPITLPRVLHNLGAVAVIGGLAVAWIGRFRGRAGKPSELSTAEHATKLGMWFFLIGIGLQVIFGFWYLLSIPGPMRKGIADFGGWVSFAWYGALALNGFAVFVAVKMMLAPRNGKSLVLATLLPVVGMVGMILARQQLRSNYVGRELAGGLDIHNSQDAVHGWVVRWQVSPTLVFLTTFVIGLLVIGLMIALVMRRKKAAAAAGQVDRVAELSDSATDAAELPGDDATDTQGNQLQ